MKSATSITSDTLDGMRREQAVLAEARAEIARWGLDASGWSVVLFDASRALGQCRVRRHPRTGAIVKQIRLARFHIRRDDIKVVRDTVLHEIAHALEVERFGRMTGHSARWRTIATEVGARPERTAALDELEERPWRWALVWGDEIVARFQRYPSGRARQLHRLGR